MTGYRGFIRGVVVWLALVLASGVGVALIDDGDPPASFFNDSDDSESSDSSSLDEDAIDTLRDQCGDGNLEACDKLYYEADIGSDDEEFGSTCGDRYATTEGDCEETYG